MEDMKMMVYPKDSSAEAVVLVDYGESTISYMERKGFQITFERLRRLKILTKEGLEWADLVFHFIRLRSGGKSIESQSNDLQSGEWQNNRD